MQERNKHVEIKIVGLFADDTQSAFFIKDTSRTEPALLTTLYPVCPLAEIETAADAQQRIDQFAEIYRTCTAKESPQIIIGTPRTHGNLTIRPVQHPAVKTAWEQWQQFRPKSTPFSALQEPAFITGCAPAPADTAQQTQRTCSVFYLAVMTVTLPADGDACRYSWTISNPAWFRK